MTEQKIEKIVINQLSAALEQADVHGIQAIGAWQAADEDELKSFESGRAVGVLGVKAYPRQYQTPTIPDGIIQVDVSLTIRADEDKTGSYWLSATDAVARKMHTWQKSYSDYSPVFAISGEFDPTGFNLVGGDCGLDRSNGTWQYTQSFNIHGIIGN